MNVCRVREMRAMDQQAISEFGINQELLMENAGHTAYQVISENTNVAASRYTIFCGIGNNGGDGLVVARKIYSNGGSVRVFLLGDPAKFAGSAALNLEIAYKIGLDIVNIENPDDAVSALARSDYIIDAIFGTGLDREISGFYEHIIDVINESPLPVFSLDIASGINGDSGVVMGTSVKADYTITFGLPKIGNLLYPGFEYNGQLSVTHISFPPQQYNSETLKISVNEPPPLPPRPRIAHKGSCGKALFIAGSKNYLGAPFFASVSYLKSGGGLSFLGTPKSIVPVVAAQGHELVFMPLEETAFGSIAQTNKDHILEYSKSVDVVVAGPGLSLDDETQALLLDLCREIDKPLLIDGDGISAISANLDVLRQRKALTIITPHFAEMTRITSHGLYDLNEKRIEIVRETAADLNSILVLKGPHTLIGYPDGRTQINLSGNPGMATAGSGDVLCGVIAAMFGQGLNPEDAVSSAVFMHGFAGDLAAREIGEDGLLASSIMEALPVAFKKYREEYSIIMKHHYGKIRIL